LESALLELRDHSALREFSVVKPNQENTNKLLQNVQKLDSLISKAAVWEFFRNWFK